MEANTVVLERPANYETTPDYDGLWKALIEELFEEFMQFFAKDLFGAIDFSRGSEFLDKELLKKPIKEKKGRVIADQLVKVFLKSGQEKWILIHIEVQGKAGKDFAKRMFRYFYRIYDKHNREVYAIALLTDAKEYNNSNRFHYEFYGTKVNYTFNLYAFQNQDIKKLEDSANPFAVAVTAGIYAGKTKHDANKRYAFKRKLMIQILQKTSTQPEHTRTYLSALFHFIDNILQVPAELTTKLKEDLTPFIDKEATQQMLADKRNPSQTLAEIFAELKEEGMEKGIKKGMEKGMVKGVVKGRKEAEKEFAGRLIQKDYSNEQVLELTELELDEIVKLRKSLQM
ncbi:hypothetical protein CFK37_08440 [Virgibacillus phasianinus]|uniref:Transposase (putative) YhgA-like domain-containing protein n=1 Tax=Virgibacillus phasianinus TaxID=2017483 RepID=A0A220U206_9BACI|nr:Rpn family recombination-promoting nuclease/putative transposase [Virgibacillus phasianinus]ASK62188.1 hypothetical protein CFK37_08440 [Virgibacillus phasianinus]